MFLHFPNTPTHYPSTGATPSTLDLILTKGFPSPVNLCVDIGLSSDHRPVLFELSDFASANWRRYASTIDSDLATAATEQMTTTEDVDDAISLLTDTIRAADAACIPRKRG